MQKFNFKNFSSNRFALVVSFVGLFLVSVGVSLLVFSVVAPKTVSRLVTSMDRTLKVNLNAPKVAECPINGAMYTQAEADIWNTRRPVVAMIENSVDARPLFGLSYADVSYEAVAEGGITRTMDIFYCAAAAQDVKLSPIRSARVYFVNMAAGYGTDPIFLHQGEANNICNTCPGGVKPSSQIDPRVNVLTLFDKLGWEGGPTGNNLDGGYNIGYPMIDTEQNRLGPNITLLQEHSRVADLDLIYDHAIKSGFAYNGPDGSPWTQGFKKWLFQNGQANPNPTASDIKVSFWSNQPDYDVEWKYDSTKNSYFRWNGGQPFIDFINNKVQISAKNVVIMFAQEKGPVDSEKHMFYQVIGTGKAMVFQNGQVITGTWSKPTILDREVFYDDNRKLIPLVRGQTWIEIVPAGNTINYR